jgi:hypothetical protein
VKESKTIRKILSSFLICLFAFGITPKVILHDLVADHVDFSFSAQKDSGPNIHISGFNCQIENFVAESPFTDNCQELAVIPATYYTVLKSQLYNRIFSQPIFYSELRGPPFAA